jgi:hypothetical protein
VTLILLTITPFDRLLLATEKISKKENNKGTEANAGFAFGCAATGHRASAPITRSGQR